MYVLREKAHAKLNLMLHVTGRQGGYHTLESLVCPLVWGDDVEAYFGPRNINKAVVINDDLSSRVLFRGCLPANTPPPDLLARVMRCAPEKLEQRHEALKCLVVQKRIPMESGLGGGSSDVAAVLRLLVTRKHITATEAWALAPEFGCDVRACFLKAPCWMEGIGNDLHVLEKPLPPFSVLLVRPAFGLSTARIFGEVLTSQFSRPLAHKPSQFNALEELIEFLHQGSNVLEDVAVKLCPSLKALLEAISKTRGCLLARMSGSGSVCFGLYRHTAIAQEAAVLLTRDDLTCYVTQGLLAHKN